MIRNHTKWVSIEDSELLVTESETVAVKAAEVIIEEQQAKAAKEKAENERIQEQQDASVKNIKEQAEDPFDPNKIEATDTSSADEDSDDSKSEGVMSDEEGNEGDDIGDAGSDSEGNDSDSETEGADDSGEDLTGDDGGSDNSSNLESGDEGLDDDGENSGEGDVDEVSEDSSEDDNHSDTKNDTEKMSEDGTEDGEDKEDSESIKEDGGELDEDNSETEDSDGDDPIVFETNLGDGAGEDDESDDEDLSEESDDDGDSETDADDEESEETEADLEDESEEVESEDAIDEAAAEEELEVEDVDLSTTDEEVEEAEEELEEAEDEGEEIEDEVIDDTKTLEDLEKETASVEEFIQLLKVAKESAHYEPLFMAQVDSKLNALHGMFGTNGPGIPSLESFNDPQHAGLYYSTSLEAFEGFKKRLNNIKNAVSLKLAESIRSLNVKMLEPAVKNLNTIIDGMLAKVNSEDSDYSVTFKVKLESDKDIVKAYGDDTKTITAMINRISKQQLRVVNEAANVLKSTTSAKFKDIPKAAQATLQIKNVDFKGLADGSLIGNNKTITKDPGKSNGTVMHQMAEHLVKSAIKVGTTEYDGDKTKKITLNKADLVRLLSLCKMQIGLVTKAKKEIGEPAVAQSKLIAKDYIKLLDDQFLKEHENVETNEDYNILYIPHGIYSGLKIVNEHTILTYKFIVYHCLGNVSVITRRLKNTIK